MSRITQSLICAALAILVNAAATVSLAATPSADAEQTSLTVRYNDLSLDRASDVAMLYHRISHAADNACGPREFTGSHVESTRYRTCFDTAVSRAVTAVASPSLSAYYRTQLVASHTRLSTLAQR